jgi:hypothetical protein
MDEYNFTLKNVESKPTFFRVRYDYWYAVIS